MRFVLWCLTLLRINFNKFIYFIFGSAESLSWAYGNLLLPGKSHGQRSLVGYSPWGRKELDVAERLHFLYFSCCSEWGLLSSYSAKASHCGGFSRCRAWALGEQAEWLWYTGLVAPRHVESSRTRDRTHVPCTGRWMLNPWTIREVLTAFLLRIQMKMVYSVC